MSKEQDESFEEPKKTENQDEVADTSVTAEKTDPETTPDDASDEPITPPAPQQATPTKPKKFARLRAFLATKKGKVVAAILAVLLVIGILMAIPITRYGILGNFVKKQVELTILDRETQKPVTEAQVSLDDGQMTTTDNNGKATFGSVAVGAHKATITKKYHEDLHATIDVWVTRASEPSQLTLQATGRQVPVKVQNKITGQPLENASIEALDTAVTTDAKGEATLVLPADQTEVEARVNGDGYNQQTVMVKVVEQPDEANTFNLTPSGKLYFLSKRTGKIDVLKSDLDGSNIETVLAGTGQESEGDTVLVASRDWKYLALKSRRDSDKPKLYLIDTSTDKLSVIDEGKASFDPLGWADHRFVYEVSREDAAANESKQVLKSFNTADQKIEWLHSTQPGEYYASDQILIGNDLFFLTSWDSSMSGKKKTLQVVSSDGSNKKTIYERENNNGYLDIKTYKPHELYMSDYTYTSNSSTKYFEYEHGQLKEADINSSDFGKAYPTYLVSPSGNETFWSESRDGKYTLLVGDAEGGNEKTIASMVEYRQYGWYSDDYLLVSKDGSELYIMPKAGSDNPLKITDYHKPAYELYYGGGYGGF